MARDTKNNPVILGALRELDSAIEANARWLVRLHRALICGSDIEPSMVAADGHLHCVFGRWYYQRNPADWEQWATQMDDIGALHEQMHQGARRLVELRTSGAVGDTAFDEFSDQAMRFKLAVRTLQFQIISEICLVDHLTGIWNRNSMFQRLTEECQRMLRTGKACFLCMIDIDHFKTVNDTHGHLVGDEVLQGMVRIVKQRLRPYDSIFRFGGEEFLVCLPETTADAAIMAMDRIREDIAEQPLTLGNGDSIRMTASFGVAPLSTTLAVEESIEVADRALFCAKAAGRNRVCRWDTGAGAPKPAA